MPSGAVDMAESISFINVMRGSDRVNCVIGVCFHPVWSAIMESAVTS